MKEIRMNIGLYLRLVKDSETQLSEALVSVADHHQEEPDMEEICRLLASWSCQKASSTERFINKYGGRHDRGAEKLYSELFQGPRRGGLALLRDLHDLWLLATEAQICWTLLAQAAQALRDTDLIEACLENTQQSGRQIAWLETRSKQAAPQTLIVA
jgi:hypothetical protein